MRALRIVAAAATAAALAGCAPEAPEGGALTVYAAASVAPAMEEIAAAFEERHPDVDVRPVVSDGSQVLATQLEEGARADVFASADEATMARVAPLIHDPVVFATNTLVLAVPSGNPAGVRALDDLARPGTTVVLCAPEVPCGAASARLLDAAGVAVEPASLEQNVGGVVTKIAVGEADAGLVYRTDALRGDVVAIEADGADEVVNRYPIAVLRAAPNPEAAREFAEFAAGPEGRAILAELGFGAP
ncbi:molybdate ABC transporter substrate-binding protein [Microbacterium sp. MEC084]|uniref:molybdate ABC transporter substrate-binding protein n=1 Tax=Microbacterium sp. MEC084 TaxID=1963027 RepID=UPI0010703CAA|nr:molybdate ABC transporter substrate-binding protein [Microbacterium sp. MEC084]MCD1269116.1 molybdate ABC transporter substrate-binding protein [Microbacterium sp. MEC084]